MKFRINATVSFSVDFEANSEKEALEKYDNLGWEELVYKGFNGCETINSVEKIEE